MEGEHRNHRVITFSIAVRVNKYLGTENNSKHKNQLKMGDIIVMCNTLLFTYIEPKNRMVRPIPDSFHDVCSVAWIVAVAKSFCQGLSVNHDGIVGVISVNGNFNIIENDRMVWYAKRGSS